VLLRHRAERVEGIAFDVVLIAVATMVSSDAVEAWLLAHPRDLYYGVAALHVVTVPAVMAAVIGGYGSAEAELAKPGPGILGWATALFLCGSFVVPGVLGLTLDQQLWVMMATVFGPFVVMGVWVGVVIVGERRGWIAPVKTGAKPVWWKVQALALLAWAYLLWLETMMLVAAGKGGPLAEVGLPMGVLIDYLPVRVMIYLVRSEASRWEVLSIAAGTLYLVIRLAAA
jgi:hypothetical protein